jgi:hypothetical protein
MVPSKRAVYNSAPLQGGILKPPVERVAGDLWLVFMDHYNVVAACSDILLGNVAWHQQRVQRYNPALQEHMAQQVHPDRDRMRLVCHRLLGEGEAKARGEDREALRARSASLPAAQPCFVIDGAGLRLVLCAGCPSEPAFGPGTQLGFHDVTIHAPQDGMQGGRTGGLVGKAQSMSELGSIIAAPVGYRAVAAVAAQQCTAREGQDRGEWMALPARAAKIWELCQDLDQRTGVWYRGCVSMTAFWLV